jgi:hypothetical protein
MHQTRPNASVAKQHIDFFPGYLYNRKEGVLNQMLTGGMQGIITL